MLPKDPAILLSYINTKLRDDYGSLEDLCAALNADTADIAEALALLDYHYDFTHNQFV